MNIELLCRSYVGFKDESAPKYADNADFTRICTNQAFSADLDELEVPNLLFNREVATLISVRPLAKRNFQADTLTHLKAWLNEKKLSERVIEKVVTDKSVYNASWGIRDFTELEKKAFLTAIKTALAGENLECAKNLVVLFKTAYEKGILTHDIQKKIAPYANRLVWQHESPAQAMLDSILNEETFESMKGGVRRITGELNFIEQQIKSSDT